MAMDGTELPPKRKSKYNNKPVERDGIKFASKREARRYHNLCLLQRAGEISELELQPKYDLVVEGMKVCSYVGDFRYLLHRKRIVEDVKSPATAKNPVYRLKKKLMQACHGITILETF